MWITCKPGEYAHKYSKAIDDQGFDYKSIDKLYAPYTGKVVRKYPSECEIWFESIDKVEFADGTIDYLGEKPIIISRYSEYVLSEDFLRPFDYVSKKQMIRF